MSLKPHQRTKLLLRVMNNGDTPATIVVRGHLERVLDHFTIPALPNTLIEKERIILAPAGDLSIMVVGGALDFHKMDFQSIPLPCYHLEEA